MPTDLQEQIERRRQRALEEIKKVVNRGSHPVFSQFEVHSKSGQLYRVEIRSLTELQNTCTCADYKTNLIGTCKHIEGVLLSLRDKHGEQPSLAKFTSGNVKRPMKNAANNGNSHNPMMV